MKKIITYLLFSMSSLSFQGMVGAQTCSCDSLGPNLITNGDFETDWISNVPGMILTHTGTCSSGYGTYGIGNTANPCYPGWNACDHTFQDTTKLKSGGTPLGHFLIIDPNTTPGNIYSKTVSVCQNTSYQFTFWAKDLLPLGDARPVPVVNIQFNGVNFFTADVTVVATTNTPSLKGVGVWQKISGCWYSGANTSIVFSIVAKNVSGNGNDLGIDDISFTSCNSVVTVVPSNPSVSCAAPCTNLTANVSPGAGTYTYSWNPGGQTTATVNVCPTVTTTYTITIGGTENCIPFTKTASSVVTVNGMIVTVPSATICPRDS
ncbi:MAG: hypothetical protein H0W84_08805, partial [Bacteroidetes bacterium]|nr:hypothetical protein [Bacteroidota bacterium]